MTPEDLRSRAAPLSNLPDEELAYLASLASEREFPAGHVIFGEGESADRLFIIESGKVVLELATAGPEPKVILSLGKGDLLGVSWMFPPYQWSFTARATDTTKAIEIDAVKVREACGMDPSLKAWVLEVVAKEAVRRLQATRMQLLDVYGGRLR